MKNAGFILVLGWFLAAYFFIGAQRADLSPDMGDILLQVFLAAGLTIVPAYLTRDWAPDGTLARKISNSIYYAFAVIVAAPIVVCIWLVIAFTAPAVVGFVIWRAAEISGWSGEPSDQAFGAFLFFGVIIAGAIASGTTVIFWRAFQREKNEPNFKVRLDLAFDQVIKILKETVPTIIGGGLWAVPGLLGSFIAMTAVTWIFEWSGRAVIAAGGIAFILSYGVFLIKNTKHLKTLILPLGAVLCIVYFGFIVYAAFIK